MFKDVVCSEVNSFTIFILFFQEEAWQSILKCQVLERTWSNGGASQIAIWSRNWYSPSERDWDSAKADGVGPLHPSRPVSHHVLR